MIWELSKILEILKEDILEITDTKEAKLNSVQMNSKDIKPGDIFIAIDGKAKEFIEDALKNGAGLCIAGECLEDIDRTKILIVKDPYQALLKLAKFKRDTSKATFIGLTGSVGKTSTKEALGKALSLFNKTFISSGNFNNHLGLPLNLASLPEDAKFVVLEMGMNHEGEIRFLTNLARPDIALITQISMIHIEHFESIKSIAEAKAEIFEGTKKIAILNKDDEFFSFLYDKAIQNNLEIYTFGKLEDGDGRLIKTTKSGDNNSVETIINDKKFRFTTNLRGEYRIFNLIPVLLIIDILKLDLNKIGSLDLDITEGRGNLFSLKIDNRNITVINDAYNASGMKDAIIDFANIEHSGRKIAVLGDMRELGVYSLDLHKDLAKIIIGTNIDKVICVGEKMKILYEILPESLKYKHFSNAEELNKVILNLIEDKDILFFKGSKSMELRSSVKILEAKNVL